MFTKRIKLGQKVRDKITGLEGITVVRSEFLFGCIRFGVQPQEVKEGKPAEWVYVDEPQLEVVKDTPAPKVEEPTYGPRPSDPGRPIDRR